MMNPSNSIRILNIVEGMDRGGVETWLMHVLRTVDRSQFEIDFLTHSNIPGDFDEEILALGSQIYRCPIRLNPLLYIWRLASILLARPRYDLVHIHMHHFSGLPLLIAQFCRVNTRIVTSYSDTRYRDGRVRFRRLAYLRFMQGVINCFSTHRLAVSRGAGVALYGDSPETQLLRMGVDTTPFRNKTLDKDLRLSLGLNKNSFVVGHVGRFVEPKNHRFIVEIAKVLFESRTNVQFLLVGDGPLRSQIESDIAAAGLSEKVIFAGTRGDVPIIMTGVMDTLILPSLWEGFPIVAIEAQFAGLPCLLSDNISNEVAINLGRTTFLDIHSPERWATEILSHMLKSKAEAPDLELLNNPYDVRNAARELTTIYAAAVSGSGGGKADKMGEDPL